MQETNSDYQMRESQPGTDIEAKRQQLTDVIKRLHRHKDAAYGNAWKRRGELVSILANIARKVDRLEQYTVTGAKLADESVFDTAVDLFVYSVKYCLFLIELMPEQSQLLPASASKPYSDHTLNFDWLVDHMSVPPAVQDESSAIRSIISTFEQLHTTASDRQSTADNRMALATQLSRLALAFVIHLHSLQPETIGKYRLV